jgi:hypothetical protein
MARLTPGDPTELAILTEAEIDVDPGGATVDLWERFVPFGGPFPDYDPAGQYTQDADVQRTVGNGTLYQARLFRADNGSSTGTGAILGKLDMPSINYEARGTFLTSCARSQKPQLKVQTGGTYVAVTVGAGIVCMVRAQVAATKPQVDGRALPFFHPGSVVASAVSPEPDLVHDLVLVDELLESDTDGHTPLTPGQQLWYVVLGWDDQGNWDYVWGTEGPAPGPSPSNPNHQSVTTKRRHVTAQLTNLLCIDDSDELSDGEAVFTLTLSSNTDEQSRQVEWDPMPSGGSRAYPMGAHEVEILEPPSNGRYRVNVHCEEDDSPADNDLAATGDRLIDCPVGRGTEVVTGTVLSLRSSPLTAGTDLDFTADVLYRITYD